MKPVIGITMGDAAGVGPEVCLKAVFSGGLDFCVPVIIGDAGVLGRAARLLGKEGRIRSFKSAEDGCFSVNCAAVLDMGGIKLTSLKEGRPDRMCGAAGVEYLMKAVSLASAGRIDGVVTAPLGKEAMALAGFGDTGHTEILSRVFREKAAMVMVHRGLRVVPVSRHLPLAKVAGFITSNRIVDTVKTVNDCSWELGIRNPRFAVLSLNPHAGDGGVLGREERTKIAPALDILAGLGMRAEGPFAADGFFGAGKHKEHDFVIAMYHDQGLIPYKMKSFGRGVNLTMGLPIVRASVDHGTGYDIAWKGEADAGSMTAALRLASRIAVRRARLKPAKTR